MAPFNGIPTHSQQVALALIPKFAAGVSIVGSSYIVFDVVRHMRNRYCPCCCCAGNRAGGTVNPDGPRRRSDTYHRLLLMMSTCDLMMSGGIFMSTWPMPREVPNVWGNVGTTQTCTAQGFFEQFGVSTVMYSASLSIYYLITIRSGRSASSRARIRRLEPYLHAVPLVFGLATAVAGLFLRAYNYGLWDCWIAPYPPGCKESWRNDGTTDCVRGDNASLYQWLFDLIPKWTSILIVTVNMILVYLHVRKQEVISERWSSKTRNPSSVAGLLGSARGSTTSASASHQRASVSSSVMAADASSRSTPLPRPSTASSVPIQESGGGPNQRAQRTARTRSSLSASRQIAHQSYLYVGALWITWLPVIVLRGTQLASGVTYYWMLIWVSLSIPTQGMWNVLVYLRPRWLQKRKEQKKERARAVSEAGEQGRRLGTESSAFGIKAVHILKDFSVAAVDVVREGDIYEDDEAKGRQERNGGDNAPSGRDLRFDNFELEGGAEVRSQRHVSSVTFAENDTSKGAKVSNIADDEAVVEDFEENQ